MTNRKKLNVVLNGEHSEKLEIIAKKQHRKYSDLIRKWIDDNFKEEYTQE